MPEELKETLHDIWIYIYNALIFAKPLWVLFTSIISYIIFPDVSYVPAAIALLIALVIDIITKYYSVGENNGGIRNALKIKKLTSETLWRGTKKKLVSVLLVMILCGLSYRVSVLPSIAIAISTICYSLMFLRESQSILENMIDAGHEDLRWMLFLVKRKQKEILKDDEKSKDDESSNPSH